MVPGVRGTMVGPQSYHLFGLKITGLVSKVYVVASPCTQVRFCITIDCFVNLFQVVLVHHCNYLSPGASYTFPSARMLTL